jgi:hypothetical protein
VKIRHFEFWNTHLFHLPIYLYWMYLALKSRSLFFFCAANPGIETGGLLGESKFKILQKINPIYLPLTLYYPRVPGINTILGDVKKAKISFPFIVKPDIGQGGWLVSMIKDENDLQLYLKKIKMPFMVQEYVDYPLEFGVLYYRYPGCEKGYITSLAVKDLLYVTGDGSSTVRFLIDKDERARCAVKNLMLHDYVPLDTIPKQGEKVLLSFIGNHSYGTKFLNMSSHINEELTFFFDCLCRSIPGFYFGRFDIKCTCVDDLKTGNFKIIELNGVGSEPLHIFDPSEKLINAYSSAFKHWKVIHEISMVNRRTSRIMKLRDAWLTYRNVTRLQRLHNAKMSIGN